MPNKSNKTIDIQPFYTEYNALPETINEEERTVSVRYATENPVLRYNYFTEEYFYEVLSTQKGDVRLEKINNGAPLLDSHNRYSVQNVFGRVEFADETEAKIRFAKDDDSEAAWQKVRDGVITKVSVGYQIHKMKKDGEEDGKPVLRAVDWEPFEISLVAIPADDQAVIRSETHNDKAKHRCVVIEENAAMRGENQTKEKGTKMPDKVKEEVRADDQNQQRGKDETATLTVDVQNAEKVREDAVKEERYRVSGIQDAVRKAGLDQEVADKLVNDGVSIDEARMQIIDQWAEKDKSDTRTQVTVGEDLSRKARFEGVQNALANRSNPSIELTEVGREWRGMTLMEMSREFLSEDGVRTRGLTKQEIAVRALSTSDFPEILANVANKTLRDAYGNVNRTFVPWATQTSLPDFKEIARVALSEAPSLDKVVEGGEYKYGEFVENAEKYRLFTYGKIINITRQTIINDDIDAFTRLPRRMGAAASRLESDLVYGILTGNPKMSDGIALFHNDHDNLSNDLLTVDGVANMESQMGMQTGLGGKDALNLSPAFLLTGPMQKLAAQKVLGVIEPNKADDVNPFQNAMQLIIEQRLGAGNAKDYYLAADPSQIDTVEYAYLDGQTGPYIESRQGFERDGMELKVRHEFAAKGIDFRGLGKSTNNAS